MINKKIKNNIGFTLVETMVAVFILTVSIMSLMTVVSNSLFAARYARNEIIVSYLAQEAIDYIRNDRDTAVFIKGPNTQWVNFVNNRYGNCFDSDGCFINVRSFWLNESVPDLCDSSGCPPLYYDENANDGVFYSTNTANGVKTSFVRKIVFALSPTNSDEVDVTVTVEWKNGGLTKARSLKTSLLKWQ